MQGITTAIVAFIFVCMAMPKLVKNRAQFYAAFVAILLMIALDMLGHMFAGGAEPSSALIKFVYVGTAILQIAAIVLLMLAAGGLSPTEFAGELAGAYEVIRRGGEEKEIIIPLDSQINRPPGSVAPGKPFVPPAAEQHRSYTLDEAGNEIPTPKKEDEGDKGIPLA
ncbi:MAG TPA: hypothetical protein VFE58_16290 [Tepidisphaeraceae bacterium]|jgi:hypothetical protein|nr:hypothetical protein [Tepidisphaeraceae bacterium]